MSRLKMDIEFNYKGFADLANQFPSIAARSLSLIGKRGRFLLKSEALSKGIRLSDKRRQKGGQYIIMSDVQLKKSQVKVYSFPLMLFENGRSLKGGKREAPRKVYPGLKAAVMSRMASYSREIETRIIDESIKRHGL